MARARRGQKDQEKQAELSKWGPRPYVRHEVIPQGLIENQRLRVSDEAPGAGREKKKKKNHHSTCHWQESPVGHSLRET